MDKVYLGDGVYLAYDGVELVLTTENGLDATNRIVLEPEVCLRLMRSLMPIVRRVFGKGGAAEVLQPLLDEEG